MTKSVVLLLVLIFPLQGMSKKSTSCPQAFVSRKSPLKRYLERDLKNLFSQVVFESYREAEKANWIGRKKHHKVLEQALSDFIEFLERAPTKREQRGLTALSAEFFEEGLRKMPGMVEFANTVSKDKAPYVQKIVQSVFTTFGKHIPKALTEGKIYEEIDWPRINLILQSIAEFDRNKPEFSLYKIKRAIEGRYSLREYILCRR